MEEAISECIDAASHEFEPKFQKDLLHAALFGRYFEEYANPSAFVKMSQQLRVLNAVRHHKIAMPLTYVQLQALSVSVIINRLVLSRHYELAMKICTYLNMPDSEGTTQILLNWSLYKVRQTNIDDDKIAKIINSKLGDAYGISYAEIARCAINAGRTNLAIKVRKYKWNFFIDIP